jgi:hypothetical protein
MPLDVLFLVDVSGSMRPHVERMARAAHQALPLLGDQDRAAIMVFDRSTRTRMPFRSVREGVERDFDNLLRIESFDGGTDITRALNAAASYVRKEARTEARRAIVLLTDDQTEFGRDELGVGAALARAEAVLSVLLVPDAMRRGPWRTGRPRGTWPGTWPGGGGGWGGVIIPPPGRFPGPVQTGGGGTQSAGSAEIARASGGEAVPADAAGVLESTLTRLRQRYALHFLLPPGVKQGEKRTIHVALASNLRRRYPGADVRFRSMYEASVTTAPPETDAEIIDASPETISGESPSPREVSGDAAALPAKRRRPAMDSSPTRGPLTIEDR